ncbi:alpha/beta hydrolase [Sulfuriflexus mobilis]|uniref:alpha/beta hydrolase n=1 Tax=Sulfuriflexus mobilis TaxID=1811807 RepID=UPI000F81BBE6|nr:carboxylesterase [Sulfuriflexus mobilis]
MNAPLETIEINPPEKADAVVIWLHGLGADGHDFEAIVPELALPQSARIRFVFPHAPLRPITINGGYVMRGWYDIAQADLGAQQDAEGIRVSQRQLEALIEAEIAAGIPAHRIILAGFSQGGVTILHTGLRYPVRLGGLMVLSAYVPLAETLQTERHAANQETPVFMAHGRNDDIIPFALAEQSREQLIKLGYQVEWHGYTMPHGVLPEEIEDIASWLRKVLKLD